jgi:Icc protein
MTLPSPLRVAQITDAHLFADDSQQLLGVPTRDSFLAVLEQVASLKYQPDLILLTGDLSQDSKPDSYKFLQSLLVPLQVPTYWLPGNHDSLAAMEQILNCKIISPQKSFKLAGWHFLLLNSQVPGCVHGYLSRQDLIWLDKQLVIAGDCPIVLGLHHPPFAVGSEWLDESTLKNPEDLFAVLDRHPQVKLVLFGHIHQEFSQRRRGVQYFGTPSTCIQFKPGSSDFAIEDKAPGFRLLHLYPDGSWWTAIEQASYWHQLDLAAKGY